MFNSKTTGKGKCNKTSSEMNNILYVLHNLLYIVFMFQYFKTLFCFFCPILDELSFCKAVKNCGSKINQHGTKTNNDLFSCKSSN